MTIANALELFESLTFDYFIDEAHYAPANPSVEYMDRINCFSLNDDFFIAQEGKALVRAICFSFISNNMA